MRPDDLDWLRAGTVRATSKPDATVPATYEPVIANVPLNGGDVALERLAEKERVPLAHRLFLAMFFDSARHLHEASVQEKRRWVAR